MRGKRIDEYIKYFSGKLDSIIELEDSKKGSHDESIFMFKKTLVMSLLDALSKIIYGNKRKRFVAFLENFGDWPDGARLSTPHLGRALELDMDPNLEPLRQYVREQLEIWGGLMKIIHLDKDVNEEDVIKHLPKSAAHTLHGIKIEKFNHYNLVYKSRNGLIHEFRELGYGIEGPGSTKPCYHQMTKLGAADETADSWELVYPLEFLVSLARTTLDNLGDYLKRNDLNPDRHFRFGSYFFDIMNPEIL